MSGRFRQVLQYICVSLISCYTTVNNSPAIHNNIVACSLSLNFFLLWKKDRICIENNINPDQTAPKGARGGSRISGKEVHMYEGLNGGSGIHYLLII